MSADMDVPLYVKAERVAMAMAEAGYPGCDVGTDDGTLLWYSANPKMPRTERRAFVASWVKACALAGVRTRCLPCSEYAFGNGAAIPRVSPDCEGTGRCSDA